MISQVVLSFGIPFALVPLVLLTRRRAIMGALVNRPLTTALASLVAALIISLNAFLVIQTFASGSLTSRGRARTIAGRWRHMRCGIRRLRAGAGGPRASSACSRPRRCSVRAWRSRSW